MDSLGDILRRMMKNRTTPSSEPPKNRLPDKGESTSDPATVAPPCPTCSGTREVWPGGTTLSYNVNKPVIPTRCPVCWHPTPIGQGRTFTGFEAVSGTDAMIAAASNFAAGNPPPGLTIIGKPGCGKTHILEAIANAMQQPNHIPVYIFMPDFLEQLRSTFEPESDWRYQDLWNRWANADVLLLDDLSDTARPTPWAVGQIERIVDKRYREAHPYVITTNGAFGSIARIWGYRIADRLFDEGSGTVQVVYNTAPSYRTGKRLVHPESKSK